MREFCERLMAQVEEQRSSREDGAREKYQVERTRNEQLQAELERSRNRYAALEAAMARELEQVRLEFDSRRRSQISRETRELTIKHEQELTALGSELRKAREEAQQRMEEQGRLEEVVGKFQLREQELQEVEEKMY
jgi:hypothetical protein